MRSRLYARAAGAWAFACVLACGCVHRQSTTFEITASEMEAAADLRSATNLPTRFTIITPAATPGDCPPELRDTGLHTTLRLYRSLYRPQADTAQAYRAVGDYTVEPRGRYGEGEDEGVRVDCIRLRAIGVVRLGVGQPPPGSTAMARPRARQTLVTGRTLASQRRLRIRRNTHYLRGSRRGENT